MPYKDKERGKEYKKKYNEKHYKIWYDNHKEQQKEYRKKYYEEHKEELSIKAKKRREENTEKFRLRDKNRVYTMQRKSNIFANKIKTTYGIDIDEYNKMFDEQEGKCAICGKHRNEFKNGLSVDHDHQTGKIRALLCNNCNPLLGHAKESIDILQKAIKYLEKHKDE
jgi:hypothetical protein